MAIVNIQIGKRDFQLACDEGQEGHLQALAKQVSARVQQLSESVQTSNDTLLLVMSALMMQDELNEGGTSSQPNPAAVQEEADAIVVEALNTISEYVEAVAEKVEKKAA